MVCYSGTNMSHAKEGSEDLDEYRERILKYVEEHCEILDEPAKTSQDGWCLRAVGVDRTVIEPPRLVRTR